MWEQEADKYWKYRKQQQDKKSKMMMGIGAVVVFFLFAIGGMYMYKRHHATPQELRESCVSKCKIANFYCDTVCKKFEDQEGGRPFTSCVEGCQIAAPSACGHGCRPGNQDSCVATAEGELSTHCPDGQAECKVGATVAAKMGCKRGNKEIDALKAANG